LFLLFNHTATEDQLSDARSSLGVNRFVEPTPNIQMLWRKVPPDLKTISAYLDPVKDWLADSSTKGDFVLIQGDFGATYFMVRFSLEIGLVPIYSTTERQVTEEHGPNGQVHLSHTFHHRRFRLYGE